MNIVAYLSYCLCFFKFSKKAARQINAGIILTPPKLEKFKTNITLYFEYNYNRNKLYYWKKSERFLFAIILYSF